MSRRRPGDASAAPGGGGSLALAAAAAAVAVAGGLVWWSGQLAGLVGRGRWPEIAPSVGLWVLLRLPGHFGHPRLAWPPPARAEVPGGVPLVAGGVASLLSGSVVAYGLVQVWRRVPRRTSAGSRRAASPRAAERTRRVGPSPTGVGAGGARRAALPSARWAGPRDLRPLVVGGPQPGRVVLGRVGRHLVATEARHSVLVLGPTQSGKTTSLAIPALLEWEGPAVATSVKGDLVAATAGWRSRLGQCWAFDPTASGAGPPGAGRQVAAWAAGWSPLAEAGDWSGAQRVAAWLVEAAPARHGLSDAEFWYSAAAKQLAPLLLAARLAGGSMADVVAWTDTGHWEEPAAVLEDAGATGAAVALAACAARDERIRSSVSTTLETVLAPFSDPEVARATSRVDVCPDELLAGRGSLYLCGPAHEQLRVQAVFAALVSSVVAAAVRRTAATGQPLHPPLLLVLDEVANIAPLRDLDGLASTAAGLGIQLVTVCQDLAQLAGRYGPDRARTIANNHRAKLVLSGVADLGTLDLVSGLAGEQAVREESFSTDLRDGRRTRSSSVAYRRLAPPDQLRRIHPGEGVLVYGHLPAARVRLRPWYQESSLAGRASGDR